MRWSSLARSDSRETSESVPHPSVKDAVTGGERQMIDFLSGVAPGKTKVLRRRQAIIAFASMVGGLTLARMTSDGELCREILRDVAHSVPGSIGAAV
jgi:TetR/AcrR family transcriptional repressor of nem operon